jgi:hypothetical protein
MPLKAELNMRMISADSLLTIVPVALSQRTGTVTRPE